MRFAPLRAFGLSFVGSLALLFAAYDAVAQLMQTPVETPRGPLPTPAQPA